MENKNAPKFLIIYSDMNYEAPFTEEQIKDLTRAHVEHIKSLDLKGILFLCGPLKGTEKAMLIFNANTYEEAESYVLKDPFIVNKCYKSYAINEIMEGNAENNYLLDLEC